MNYGDKGLLGPCPFASIVLACNRSKYQVMGKNGNKARKNIKETLRKKKKRDGTVLFIFHEEKKNVVPLV